MPWVPPAWLISLLVLKDVFGYLQMQR